MIFKWNICADGVGETENNINSLIATKLRIKFYGVVRTEVTWQIDIPQQLRSDTFHICIMKWCQSLTFLKMTEKIGRSYFCASANEAQRPRTSEVVISVGLSIAFLSICILSQSFGS